MSEIVVFLPGIMGSELRLGAKRIWPGSVGSLIGSYKQMDELLRPELVPADVIRSYSVADQYQALLDDLQKFGFKEGATLFPFPYDWRKSNALAAGLLADLLDTLAAQHTGAEITLLAHSMGGLVSRYYLESGAYAARPAFASVRRLITLGTPHLGAPLALSAAVGQEKRLFLSAEQVHQLASDPRYPSLYQLLPVPGEPFAWDGRFGKKLAPLDVYAPAIAAALGLVAANLDSARAFRSGLDFARRPQGVGYFLFYGTRQTTIGASSLNLGAAGAKVTNVEIEDGGDGTVPVWSGMGAGLQGRAVGGEHGSIYKNDELRRTLATLFGYTGTLAAEVSVEVAVRDRVVEPDSLLHVVLSLGSGVSVLAGTLQLERAKLDAGGELEGYVAFGAARSLSFTGGGAAAERIALTLDAPDLAGLYRLSFLSPQGARLGSDDFFVQEPE